MTNQSERRCRRIGMFAACLLLGGSALAVAEAQAQVRVGVGIAVPGVSIGINIPDYPELVPVPGYPVYYAPRLNANLFFYDGLYWVLAGDDWYYSSWYDGPWYLAQPELVPDFILRVPILYYRRPPAYFLHWNRAAPPRWGEHWGRSWQERRSGWDRWNHRVVPPRAPLPGYQRQYPQGRYPGPQQQRNLENRYYPYRPAEPGIGRRVPPPPPANRPAPNRAVPDRPAPERRRPEPPVQGRGMPPGAMQPRGNPKAPLRQEQRKQGPSRGEEDRGQRPRDRPPGG